LTKRPRLANAHIDRHVLVALPSLPVFSSDSLPLCIHRAPLSISATPRREGLSVVMKEGTRFSRVGTTPGLPSALAIIRLFASELYRVSPADPAAFNCSATIVPLVTPLACYIPTRHAHARRANDRVAPRMVSKRNDRQ
jgi:hypothetical protein